VFTNVSYTLAANVENMYLYGSISGNGNAGANTIVGVGAGDNTINGGAGSDTLYGGAGNDVFVFDSSSFLNSVISGIDTIGDFAATQDKIQLSKAAFAALSTSAGTLSAYNSTSLTGDFVTVTNATQATFAASTATILYNSDTGALFYNADGNIAGFGNGGQFATLTSGLGLTNNDFRAIA
jgi:Ca2+-binding RTX toxin-like protein